MFKHYINFVSGVLRDEAGDGAGGGGTDKASDKAAAFDPIAFKTEFKTELMADFDKKFNGHSRSSRKDFEKFTTELLAKIGGGNGEDKGEDKGGDKSGEGDKGGSGKGGDADANAWRLKMEKKLTDAEAEIKKHSDRAEKAEKDKRESSRLAELKNTLSGINDLMDDKTRTALYKIMNGDVVYDEDDSIVFNTEKGPLPLTVEAIRGWVESEYPRFLQPKGSGGAGAKSGGKRGNEYVPQITDDFAKLSDENKKTFIAKVSEVAKEAQFGSK